MPAVLAMLAPLLMFAIVMGALSWTVAARWQFEHAGRSIELIRYTMRVVVKVDGQVVKGTLVSRSSMHTQEHALRLDGRLLRLRLDFVGQGAHSCRVWAGDEVVFDSREAPLGPLPRTDIPEVGAPPWALDGDGVCRSGRVPPVAPRELTSLADAVRGLDPRRAATRELLADLARAQDPEVVARAHGLNERITSLLRRIEQIRNAANHHATLGGVDETEALLQRLEGKLRPALSELRGLHLELLGGPRTQPTLAPVKALPKESLPLREGAPVRGAASRCPEADPSPRGRPARRWDAG